jgi:hypothetical protein
MIKLHTSPWQSCTQRTLVAANNLPPPLSQTTDRTSNRSDNRHGPAAPGDSQAPAGNYLASADTFKTCMHRPPCRGIDYSLRESSPLPRHRETAERRIDARV